MWETMLAMLTHNQCWIFFTDHKYFFFFLELDESMFHMFILVDGTTAQIVSNSMPEKLSVAGVLMLWSIGPWTVEDISVSVDPNQNNLQRPKPAEKKVFSLATCLNPPSRFPIILIITSFILHLKFLKLYNYKFFDSAYLLSTYVYSYLSLK